MTTGVLDLSRLGLTRLPDELRELRNLEVVFLHENQIEEFPPWIGELSALKGIGAVDNRLRTLPEEIGQLKQLRGLGLTNNRLEKLPSVLRELRIRELHLDGNPKLDIPQSIISNPMRAEEILRYYFESRDEKGNPLQELK